MVAETLGVDPDSDLGCRCIGPAKAYVGSEDLLLQLAAQLPQTDHAPIARSSMAPIMVAIFSSRICSPSPGLINALAFEGIG
jgi:hypothetical protein